MGLVVAVLLLTGCTGEDESAPEPSNGPDGQVTTPAGDDQGPGEPSTEPQEEPEQDYPAPERPEAMENNDIDGAEAAGIYFLELFYYALATGDLQVWEEMSGETCGFCATTHENITEVYEAGGYFEASPPDIESVSSHISTDERGEYFIEVRYAPLGTTEYDESGSIVTESGSAALRTRVLLSYPDDDGWVIEVFQAEEVSDA